MLRHPADLDDEQQLRLKEARANCPHLDAIAAYVSAFAAMLTGGHRERLDSSVTASKQTICLTYSGSARATPRASLGERRQQLPGRPLPAGGVRAERGPDQRAPVPDSAAATQRACGNAPGRVAFGGRPKYLSFSGVSGMSVVDSVGCSHDPIHRLR